MAKRQLKYWNGRGHSRYQNQQIMVAAYSQKQCADLVSEACFGREGNVSVNEINTYYSNCWGNSMKGIESTEPGVWVVENFGEEPPKKIL